MFYSPPAWWEAVGAAQGGATNTVAVQVYRYVVQNGDPLEFVFALQNITHVLWGLVNLRKQDVTTPLNASAGQSNAASTTAQAPSITTTVNNAMLIGVFAGDYLNAGT